MLDEQPPHQKVDVAPERVANLPNSRTAASVPAGGIAATFSPTSTGSATIEATAPNFLPGFPLASETISVTVNPATMTISDLSGLDQIGGGLQSDYRVTLSGGDHGGVTVRVAGSDPSTLLIAPDATTGGTSFIDVDFPDGTTTRDIVLQGVRGAADTVDVTASSTGFTPVVKSVEVVAPVLDIVNLATTHNAGDADDAFQIRTGIPNEPLSAFQAEQEVSAAEGAITVTVTSSAPAVATLTTTAATGASVDVTVAVDASRSASNVAAGGVALDFVAAGSTDVTATATDFIAGFVTDTTTVNVGP